jgi:hypothetical protein
MIALENILPNRYRALFLFHHYYQIATKMLKCQMYERAGLELLTTRFILAH